MRKEENLEKNTDFDLIYRYALTVQRESKYKELFKEYIDTQYDPIISGLSFDALSSYVRTNNKINICDFYSIDRSSIDSYAWFKYQEEEKEYVFFYNAEVWNHVELNEMNRIKDDILTDNLNEIERNNKEQIRDLFASYNVNFDNLICKERNESYFVYCDSSHEYTWVKSKNKLQICEL